ncbi:MAG: hypothetical protein NC310_02150 [Roseburia sp.]|nr:hypothetical protein [Anaeroplasma bactoclasticum]MCM1195857.1 hypothetical protein [Roseburia sp.]MCM1556555.1 hypothetical protein [Anaeroplasma bactoclasticum]
MKKNIAIFGGSLFQDIKYENGKYIPTSKQSVIKLSGYYRIDNYSLEGMNIERASHLIQSLPMKELYNDCILALGEHDIEHPDFFEKSLRKIIDELQENHIRPLLVSLPKEIMQNPKAILIQDILDKIAVEKNVDYIYEGHTTKLVSYMILENQDIANAILYLC